MPGLVSTLFHHMYSVPLRSVQMFLQAMLQVWQPMHLSRWKTMRNLRSDVHRDAFPLPFEFGQFADQDVGVTIAADRSPVVEMVSELAVAARHQVGLQARARQAVMPAGPAVTPQRRHGH